MEAVKLVFKIALFILVLAVFIIFASFGFKPSRVKEAMQDFWKNKDEPGQGPLDKAAQIAEENAKTVTPAKSVTTS